MADVVINVGAVSAITAGTGLTGGTITGTGTIAASFGTTAGTICQGNDARIGASVAPLAHASTHTAAGSDPLTLSQAQITNLGTDLAAKVAGTRQVIAGTGMSGGGALSADVTLNVSYGTSGTTACVGNDARLSNARTPSTHASTHGAAGADAITITQAQVTSLVSDLALKASTTHATTHASAGSDPLTLGQSQITGLVASLTAKALGTTTMTAGTGLTGGGDLSANRTFTVAYGTSSSTACVGNDARLTDSRAPNGSATGDLSGTYPAPVVAKLQGVAVQSSAPASGDSLVYVLGSTEWQSQPVTDVQAFTTAGAATWTKPIGCKAVEIICIGGGGGGGSGHAHASGNKGGGGGGGGAGITAIKYAAADLPATLTLAIGAAGTGGAGVAAPNTGNTGVAGGISTAISAGITYAYAVGGLAGAGGSTSGGAAGAASTAGDALYIGGAGGAGGTASSVGATAGYSVGAPGGGGGGGMPSGGTAFAGGTGGTRLRIGTGGTSTGGAGSAVGYYGSGGGGSPSIGGTSVAGGAGIYGSGGGGSGAATAATGAGGAGGAGIIVVISEF
jgi:hypothetical protein